MNGSSDPRGNAFPKHKRCNNLLRREQLCLVSMGYVKGVRVKKGENAFSAFRWPYYAKTHTGARYRKGSERYKKGDFWYKSVHSGTYDGFPGIRLKALFAASAAPPAALLTSPLGSGLAV